MNECTIEDRDNLKELFGNAGSCWLKSIDEDQLDYFILWAKKCQTFRLKKTDPKWIVGNTLDAFRGFCVGVNKTKG